MNDESDLNKGQTSPLDDSRFESLLNNQTAIVSGGTNRVKRVMDEQASDVDTIVTDAQSIVLVIRGITEPLHFGTDRTEAVLGRIDHQSPTRPDVDLNHLGAAERGVSRRHARLELRDGQLYITDLNSSNGTFLKNARLHPYTPVILHRGDEIVLGRLAVNIVFS